MIGQSLSNTNETCYSIQVTKICNLNEALLRPPTSRARTMDPPVDSPKSSRKTAAAWQHAGQKTAAVVQSRMVCRHKSLLLQCSKAAERAASRAAERARVVITLAHVLRGFQRGRSTGRVLGGNKQPFSRCRPSRVRIGAIQILEENMPVAVHLATN